MRSVFRTDVQVSPRMMEEMYEDRKKFKKQMIQAQKDYEKKPRKDLENLISKVKQSSTCKKSFSKLAYALGCNTLDSMIQDYDNLQLAYQLSIRWIENKLNGHMNDPLKTQTDYVVASDTDSIYLNLGRSKHCV